MWLDHAFIQRNKLTERAVGLRLEVRGRGCLTKFEKRRKGGRQCRGSSLKRGLGTLYQLWLNELLSDIKNLPCTVGLQVLSFTKTAHLQKSHICGLDWIRLTLRGKHTNSLHQQTHTPIHIHRKRDSEFKGQYRSLFMAKIWTPSAEVKPWFHTIRRFRSMKLNKLIILFFRRRTKSVQGLNLETKIASQKNPSVARKIARRRLNFFEFCETL